MGSMMVTLWQSNFGQFHAWFSQISTIDLAYFPAMFDWQQKPGSRSQKFSPQAHSKLGKIMAFLKPLLICCSPNFGAKSTIFQVFSSDVPENLAKIQNFNFQITGLSHIFAGFLDDQAPHDPKVAILKNHGRGLTTLGGGSGSFGSGLWAAGEKLTCRAVSFLLVFSLNHFESLIFC